MKNFNAILEEAFVAGMEALKKCVPKPVHFYPADLMGNKTGPGSLVQEGNCGGAYLNGFGGKSELVNFFKKNGTSNGMGGVNARYTLLDGTGISKDVYKGYTLHAPTNKFYNGQSFERYSAFYEAYAKVLRNHGIQCNVRSYMT